MARVEDYKDGNADGSEAELRAQLEQLKAENDRLGEMVADAESTCAALREEAAALRASLEAEGTGETSN